MSPPFCRAALCRLRLHALGMALLALSQGLAHADWPTHRGDSQRTGVAGGEVGPKTPGILWVHLSREQYIASPVPTDGVVFVSSLGAFNTARFEALAAEPGANRVVWSKAAPALKLPVVSAPAVANGKLVFGDGMHQTDGAILHCCRATTGLDLWQFVVPGRLVHLEGGPTIADGKVYIGGGNAGVICVDLNRVTLDGREQPLATVESALDAQWKALLVAYEAEKKKDPDFAVPPSTDSLPKPAPVRVWQQGQDQWHVDAALAVDAGRVYVASAFLDDEKSGDRALLCLRADDGSAQWKTPLKFNPWAGPTLTADLVLVGCSSIRFDPKLIRFGKGEIVAVRRSDGGAKWRRSIPGGVVSAIAVRGKTAVFTATDGKIRAVDVESGNDRWSYSAGAPFFAGVAATVDAVYAADLKGIVHALSLTDGRKLWTLDLATAPQVKSPGMVYGSPVVQSGRLYVATCNLEEGAPDRQTAVVCIGEK